MGVVRADAADPDNLAAKRDYAMLRFYFATGKRREEIARLTWGDLKIDGGIVIRAREKGGKYRSSEIADPGVKTALYDYLRASGRMVGDRPTLAAEDALWLRHDRAAQGMQPLTSHGFVKAFKTLRRAGGPRRRASAPDAPYRRRRHRQRTRRRGSSADRAGA